MATNKKRSNSKKRSNKKRVYKGVYKGGNINIPARYYYPLNTFSSDPQRDIQTSLMKGGCGCGMKGGSGCGMKGVSGCSNCMTGGKRKNHTRKYLKSGGSFFSNFGTSSGASSISAQIMGTSVPATEHSIPNLKPAFLV
jgi:hypothetical protein